MDLAAVEPTFALYPEHMAPRSEYTPAERARINAIRAYYHEKPYLAEALRRSDN